MKYKSLLIISLSTLLMVAGCNKGNNINTTTSTITNTTTSTTSSNKEEYQVILSREIDGVEVIISNSTPIEGEKVRIFVTNKIPSSIRITNVEVNDVSLEGFNTNVKDCKAYDFVMPSNSNAVINIEVADVYLVTVANNVKSILSLAGIGEGLFLEGEKVTFTPTTYAGYWYKDVTLVDADVDLIKNSDGSYSFTMPNHTVTVTASTGVNYYRVTYSDQNNPYQVSFENGTSFEYGKPVNFKVIPNNSDIEISGVSSQGLTISKAEDVYEFVMPAHPIHLDIEYIEVYKEFQVVNSNSYEATLKVEKDGNQVDVTNLNVSSNQKVYLDISKKSGIDSSNAIIEKVEVYGGASFDGDLTLLNNVELDGVKYSFTTLSDYKCYKVVLIEKEQQGAFIGTFRGIKMSDAYSMYTLSFLEGNEVKRNTYSGIVAGNHPYYEYAVSDGYGTDYGYKAYVSPNSDAVLEFNTGYSWKGVEYPTEKGYLNSSLSIFTLSDSITNTVDEIEAFSVISCDNAEKYMATEFYSELIVLKRLDGTEITCFYEFASGQVYWNVSYSIIGTNGKTEGDIVEVTSAEGNKLITMQVGVHKTAFQHRANVIN